MWNICYTTANTSSPAAVFAALRDHITGATSGTGGDTFEIHGPFAIGTQVSVTPQGQPTFTSTIVELEEPSRYADETTFGDLTLTFRHIIGEANVSHELVIDGAEASLELAMQIAGDFPQVMTELLAHAVQ